MNCRASVSDAMAFHRNAVQLLGLLLLALLLLCGLLRLKQRQIFGVTFLFQFLHRYELQRGGVHAETLTGRRRAVVKEVAEVRIARFPTDLNTLHSVRSIALFRHAILLNGLSETWPAGAAIEFVERTKERFAGDKIDVNSRLVIVPVGIVKWRLCAALTRHLVLVLG